MPTLQAPVRSVRLDPELENDHVVEFEGDTTRWPKLRGTSHTRSVERPLPSSKFDETAQTGIIL